MATDRARDRHRGLLSVVLGPRDAGCRTVDRGWRDWKRQSRLPSTPGGPMLSRVASAPEGRRQATERSGIGTGRRIAWKGEVGRGEIHKVAPHFFRAWESVCPRRIVIDLSEVTFLDSAALELLLDVLDQCSPDEWVRADVGENTKLLRTLRLLEGHSAFQIV